jgi:hypothetical protein
VTVVAELEVDDAAPFLTTAGEADLLRIGLDGV